MLDSVGLAVPAPSCCRRGPQWSPAYRLGALRCWAARNPLSLRRRRWRRRRCAYGARTGLWRPLRRDGRPERIVERTWGKFPCAPVAALPLWAALALRGARFDAALAAADAGRAVAAGWRPHACD